MNSSRTQDPTARQVKKIRAKARIIRDSMRISIVLLLVRCDLRGKREIKNSAKLYVSGIFDHTNQYESVLIRNCQTHETVRIRK